MRVKKPKEKKQGGGRGRDGRIEKDISEEHCGWTQGKVHRRV